MIKLVLHMMVWGPTIKNPAVFTWRHWRVTGTFEHNDTSVLPLLGEVYQIDTLPFVCTAINQVVDERGRPVTQFGLIPAVATHTVKGSRCADEATYGTAEHLQKRLNRLGFHQVRVSSPCRQKPQEISPPATAAG